MQYALLLIRKPIGIRSSLYRDNRNMHYIICVYVGCSHADNTLFYQKYIYKTEIIID